MSAGPEDILQMQVAPCEAERFWGRCDRSGGPEACWPFSGAQAPNGYGKAKMPVHGSRQTERTHRIAFLIQNGWLPKGRSKASLVIRHACDNRICCNPAHLEAGTQAQNVNEAIVRGRHVPPPHQVGDDHPRSRLSAEKVAIARALHAQGSSCASLARRFGVGETTMGHALAQRTWKDPS